MRIDDVVLVTPTHIGSAIVDAPWCSHGEAKNAGLSECEGGNERVMISLQAIPKLILDLAAIWVKQNGR